MRQFQKVFSDRATNAFGACLCNDSNGMTAIEAKAPVRCIAVQAICGIVLCPMCEGCNRRCSASRLQPCREKRNAATARAATQEA